MANLEEAGMNTDLEIFGELKMLNDYKEPIKIPNQEGERQGVSPEERQHMMVEAAMKQQQLR